jgi:hypothetical protein
MRFCRRHQRCRIGADATHVTSRRRRRRRAFSRSKRSASPIRHWVLSSRIFQAKQAIVIKMLRGLALLIFALALSSVGGLAPRTTPNISRRQALGSAAAAALTFLPTSTTLAAADCFQDCLTNCKVIAPKNPEYCQATCQQYCEQDDRTDGLSGSVSYSGGEVGILGGTFGTGTVVKGQDKPPVIKLPGIDFSSEKGKQLIGY